MSEQNPLIPDDTPVAKTQRAELLYGVELELSELLSGNAMQRVDDNRESRKKARPLIQANHGVNITDDEVNWYTWVSACCTGVFKDGEKIADSITFDEVVKASAYHKDLLRTAGLTAWMLTTGITLPDEEGEKKGDSETDTLTPPTPENESSE